MRWSVSDHLPDVKRTIDRFHIYDRVVNRNKAKIWAAGSPCTYWRNSAITPLGTAPEGLTKCYCWQPDSGESQQSQPDRKHFLCLGTGYLKGYQKYGYEEITLSTPSEFTLSSDNIIRSGTRSSAYIISGTTLSESLTSERFELTNLLEVDHFLATESIDIDQNKVEYEYSTDDTTWIDLDVSDYSNSKLANMQAPMTLSTGTVYIRFRITLRKRYATSQSPKWNSMRFRYRKQIALSEMDPRFDIHIPSFLAAREQQTKQIEQGEHGWTTKFPVYWWTLPDANIQNADVIMFLQGTYEAYRFETLNLQEFTYGNHQQILHKGFETALIRDENELLGIVHLLI